MTASAWMVRAGQHGERAEQAVGEGLATVGWTGLPDLRTCRTRQDLRRLLGETFPNRTNYGDRPPVFDRTVYRRRTMVERCFQRLKQFHAIAARYDKIALSY
ncbi:hypothetical protein [Kibdelosporangium philippinense]|uniref:hypothetical protein n=1 Tax=Kibdelosporangium philippinense TaxID=211113 RepID=UPI0035E817FF